MGLNGPISQKLLVKSRNQNIFEKFELNQNLRRIHFKMMYNMSGGGGGGGGWTTSLSYSVKLCNIFRSFENMAKGSDVLIDQAYLYILGLNKLTRNKANLLVWRVYLASNSNKIQ